jgi:uncharacterized protein (TIGR01370 family)
MVFRFDILLMLTALMAAGSGSPRGPWVVYYSDAARPEEFRGYDLVVFDGDIHPPLKPISAKGSVVLGYLSLCEVERHRKWFAAARDSGLLVGENPDWPGSYFVDLREPRWRKIVAGQLAPEIMAQGFQGLFLDTLDDAADLERRDPRKFRGMKAAAVQLVRDIRRDSPAATLMVNRGYDLVPEVAASVNIVLGESVYGTYDFATRSYHRVPSAEYRQQVALLTGLRSIKPSLRICTLDYWDPADRVGIRQVYREERSHGFDPYVGTISLDRLVKEPR